MNLATKTDGLVKEIYEIPLRKDATQEEMRFALDQIGVAAADARLRFDEIRAQAAADEAARDAEDRRQNGFRAALQVVRQVRSSVTDPAAIAALDEAENGIEDLKRRPA